MLRSVSYPPCDSSDIVRLQSLNKIHEYSIVFHSMYGSTHEFLYICIGFYTFVLNTSPLRFHYILVDSILACISLLLLHKNQRGIRTK